jgi:hypothetical protein
MGGFFKLVIVRNTWKTGTGMFVQPLEWKGICLRIYCNYVKNVHWENELVFLVNVLKHRDLS